MKVMHYYTYPKDSGGPLTYINNIIESKYLNRIEFGTVYQGKPASQIKKEDKERIIREIRAFSPDILHVHGVQSEGFFGVYLGKRAKVRKILMTVHGLQIDAQNIGRIKRDLFRFFIEPYALRHSDGVYCVCDKMTEREFIKKHSKCLFPTVHNFVTDRFIEDVTEEKETAKEETIVTTVGRVSFDKGMVELTKVIKSDVHKNVRFRVIGSGDYEEKMKADLSDEIKNGKVVFYGQTQDVRPLLKQSDIFLFLSHHENLSLALLEAASQNCCCIATDVGGNSEIISSGTDGLLVPAYDAEGASAALNSVIDDPELRKRMSININKKIRSEFSEELFSQRLLNVYHSLLK